MGPRVGPGHPLHTFIDKSHFIFLPNKWHNHPGADSIRAELHRSHQQMTDGRNVEIAFIMRANQV